MTENNFDYLGTCARRSTKAGASLWWRHGKAPNQASQNFRTLKSYLKSKTVVRWKLCLTFTIIRMKRSRKCRYNFYRVSITLIKIPLWYGNCWTYLYVLEIRLQCQSHVLRAFYRDRKLHYGTEFQKPLKSMLDFYSMSKWVCKKIVIYCYTFLQRLHSWIIKPLKLKTEITSATILSYEDPKKCNKVKSARRRFYNLFFFL